MPKADIWMPIYIGDYLADTGHLTTEQHGAYLLMLMHYWRKGPLPDDDRTLAQITRLSVDAWSIAKNVLTSFFALGDDGKLHQKRIEEELEGWKAKKQKAKRKAELAAQSRWEKYAPSIPPSIASSNTQALLGPCPSSSPSHIQTKSDGPTGEMLAKEVCNALGISGRELFATLADVCRGELQHGVSADDLLANLVATGRRFAECRSQLYMQKPEVFFGGGTWRQAEVEWPWKHGSPPKPKSKTAFIPAQDL